MKKSTKIKDIDQNAIEEEMARIIPSKMSLLNTKRNILVVRGINIF